MRKEVSCWTIEPTQTGEDEGESNVSIHHKINLMLMARDAGTRTKTQKALQYSIWYAPAIVVLLSHDWK